MPWHLAINSGHSDGHVAPHEPSQRKARAEQAAVEAARAAADHRIAARARKMVEIWNARSELFFYPTIRAAITAV